MFCPPDRMRQELQGASRRHRRVVERVTVMPATPGIRAVAHLSEEHGFVGMATAGEASGTVQKEFCRTVEAYGGDGAFDDQIGRASCRERVCKYVYVSVVAGS